MAVQLRNKEALLVVVDLQVRLLPAIFDAEAVVRRSAVLIRAARRLGVPIVWTEQYKKGLGETDPAIREAIGESAAPLEKLAFGCLDDEAIARAVADSGRRQLVLCGIETHVCVMQTALRGLERGYEVFLAEDAIGSRRASDRETALRRMAQAGAVPATAEMLIMELLGRAGTDEFKAVLPLIREV